MMLHASSVIMTLPLPITIDMTTINIIRIIFNIYNYMCGWCFCCYGYRALLLRLLC